MWCNNLSLFFILYIFGSVSHLDASGSKIQPNNTTDLSSDNVSVRLLYGDSHGVTWTDLSLQDRLPPVFTHMYLDVKGLDYHFDKRLLFYSGLDCIWRLSMNESGFRPMVIVKKAEGATSVAVDWVLDQVYWVNQGNRSVWRTSLMGIGPELFLADTGHLTWYSNIVLDPYYRLLFLALDGRGYSILRADMTDGSKTMIQVEGHGEKKVISLALDIHYQRLYVSARYDHFPTILSCNYDGTQVQEYDLSDEWWGSLPSVGARGNQLFWVHHGWSQRDTVWKATAHRDGSIDWEKEYTSRGTFLDPNIRIWVMKVYHPDMQKPWILEDNHEDGAMVMQMTVTCASHTYRAHAMSILALCVIIVLS